MHMDVGWHKRSASHHFLVQCAPLIDTLRLYITVIPAQAGIHA